MIPLLGFEFLVPVSVKEVLAQYPLIEMGVRAFSKRYQDTNRAGRVRGWGQRWKILTGFYSAELVAR